MKKLLVIAALLAACTPGAQTTSSTPAQGPEAVITDVFAAAGTRAAAGQVTTIEQVPFSEALVTLIGQAEETAEANEEPFIDGDLVLSCQDCAAPKNLTIALAAPPANGRATVTARFSMFEDAVRGQSFDMVETPQGWRIDNIRSEDGYDLRQAAQQEIASGSTPCSDARGAEGAQELVGRCTEVSPATHPPCNAANSCQMIISEIRRGCDQLDAAQRPAFCANPAQRARP